MSGRADINFALLKRLCEAPGVPGYEDQVREIVKAEMGPLVDEMYVDALGNVIGTKKGSGGPRVMLSAHMDEIGFFVKYIDDNGCLRLQPLGGLNATNLVTQRVLVHTRGGQILRGALQSTRRRTGPRLPDESKPLEIDDLFVDIGLLPDAVKGAVEVGDMVTMDRTCERVGDTVLSKSLDDRVGVFLMLETLRALGAHSAEVIAVASVQEEVGLRGATTAAFGVAPDVGIAIDITPGDNPGGDPAQHVSRIRQGAAIKLMDGSVITNHRLVRHFRDVAEKHGIQYQLEILPFGGTDAGALQRARAGAPAITISIPTRYAHTVNEMAAVSDLQAIIRLVARYLEEAHTGDYRLG